jgi:hypothetical protein
MRSSFNISFEYNAINSSVYSVLNKIFLGRQPRQVVKVLQCFRQWLCPHLQGAADEIRCQEHIIHLCHVQSENSAVAEHLQNMEYEIQLEKKHIDWPGQPPTTGIEGEAIEIQLHPRNFNREAGFTLSRTWQLIISMLKQSAEPFMDSLGQVHWFLDPTH